MYKYDWEKLHVDHFWESKGEREFTKLLLF